MAYRLIGLGRYAGLRLAQNDTVKDKTWIAHNRQ